MSTDVPRKKPNPMAMLRLLAGKVAGTVKDNVSQEIGGMITRLDESTNRLLGAFSSPEGNYTSPQYVQKLSDGIVYQLAHLDAEATLQTNRLSAPGKHDPLMLEVAIYGLSGIREQLDTIVQKFEDVSALARQQVEAKQEAPDGPGPVDPFAASGVHEPHPVTKVQYDVAEPPARRSFMSRVLNRKPSVLQGNDKLAQKLAATYQQFSRETAELQKAFRTAAARTLVELAVPMDLLRGTASWLQAEEMTFYRPAATAGSA